MAKKKQPIHGNIDDASEKLERKFVSLDLEINRRLAKGQDVEVAVNGAWESLGMDVAIAGITLDQLKSAFKKVTIKAVIDDKKLETFFLDKMVDPDKVKLSSRLFNTSKASKQIIIDELKTQLRLGRSWQAVARAIDNKTLITGDIAGHLQRTIRAGQKAMSGDAAAIAEYKRALKRSEKEIARLARFGAPTTRLKKAYAAVILATERANKKALGKAVERATKAKSRFNAERVSRTEIARAYKEAVNVEMASDSDIVGYRSTLSARHPAPDICDFYANADLHGMGPGVYPKISGPAYPYHPHCTCVLTPVFRGEMKKNMIAANGESFIGKMPTKGQNQLFGVAKAKEFRKDPKKWQRLLNVEYESKRAKIPTK